MADKKQKHPGGRPPNLSPARIKELKAKFEKYIDDTDIPILAEFAYQNDISRQSLYDYEQFSTLREKCINKKSANLQKFGLFNVTNPAVTIFSLKQLRPERMTKYQAEMVRIRDAEYELKRRQAELEASSQEQAEAHSKLLADVISKALGADDDKEE